MNSVGLAYAALAAASGLLIPVMAALNGGLGRLFGNPVWAAALLLLVSAIAAFLFALVSRVPLPGWPVLAGAPRPMYAAGLVVTFYVFTVTYLAPRFGVANTIMFVLLAQLVSAAAIDRLGLFGVPARELSPIRIIGLATMLAGIVLCQWRR